MPPLRIAIVDDEPLARSRLRRLLSAHADVEIVGDHDDAGALLATWEQSPADLVLLDVEMPEVDGFSAAAQLSGCATQIVFVTAWSEHAARAFDIAATDYLVKPVAPDRLRQMLQRVRAQIRPAAAPEPVSYPTRLALPSGRRTELVEVERIDCAVAQANYVEIRAGGRLYLIRRPLGVFATELDPRRFARIHRSALVRLGAVADVESLDSGRYRLRLADGSSLTSGRSYREPLRRALGLPM